MLTLTSAGAGLSRETRDTWFLLAVIGGLLALQAPHLPLWCTVLTAGVLLARAVLAWHNRPLPGWPWRLGLLVAASAATAWQHRTLLGPEAGVTLIVLLLALKTLELRARRDAFVVFFLGFFTLLTQFFHSQSLPTALGSLLVLLGLLTGLVNAHMPVGRPSLWQTARWAGHMALWGVPTMALLFVLFPRLGPLWGMPSNGASGRSGLSGEMAVGQIASLALDDSVAFRVEFDGPPPPQALLYFRGPVLSRFDGRQWLPPMQAALKRPLDLQPQGPAVRYRVTLEPSNRPWLMLLDAALSPPEWVGASDLAPPFMTPDLQWVLHRPLTDVLRYTASSHTAYRYGPQTKTLALQAQLELPPGYNPRTLQLAQDMRQSPGHPSSDAGYVQAALERLRTGGYRYTLEPGLYGTHTADEFWFDRKAGFCEHIASSFVVLMRALDIPARLVTGYQGGERNTVDGFWTVRQSDAHAWTEVWLQGQGWVRVDPTAHVMPSRTGSPERLRPAPGFLSEALVRVNPNWLAHMRHLWDATNNRWNQWVLNYTQTRQLDLLRHLGFSAPDRLDLLRLLGLALALAGLGGAIWTLWQRHPQDPWLRLLDRARRHLQHAGWPVPPQSTPRQLANLLHDADDPSQAQWRAWLKALERQRYDPRSQVRLAEVARDFKRLAPLGKPGATDRSGH